MSAPIEDVYGVVKSFEPTPDAPIEPISRAIYVGTSGDVAVTYADGSIDTIPDLAAGVWHPMQVTMVNATGTTATDIRIGY